MIILLRSKNTDSVLQTTLGRRSHPAKLILPYLPCVRAKQSVDYREKNSGGGEYLDQRDLSSKFYLRMTNKKEYDEVDKTCFVEIFNQSVRGKNGMKFKPALNIDPLKGYRQLYHAHRSLGANLHHPL